MSRNFQGTQRRPLRQQPEHHTWKINPTSIVISGPFLVSIAGGKQLRIGANATQVSVRQQPENADSFHPESARMDTLSHRGRPGDQPEAQGFVLVESSRARLGVPTTGDRHRFVLLVVCGWDDSAPADAGVLLPTVAR